VTDTKSKEARSRNMRAIVSRNTVPELQLRKALWHAGCRFFTAEGWQGLKGTKLTGSPDLIFPSSRVVVFVDGCFWHGCPVHYTEPDDNRDYWKAKLERNKARDALVTNELQSQGWRVLRVWEHDLRRGGFETVARTIRGMLEGFSD